MTLGDCTNQLATAALAFAAGVGLRALARVVWFEARTWLKRVA